MIAPEINLVFYVKREQAEAAIPDPLPEGVSHAAPELEPDRGWVVVLHCPEKINPKYAEGVEWRVAPKLEPRRRSRSTDSDDPDEEARKRERRERRRLRRAARKRAQGK